MALLAAVTPRGGSELSLVFILVAVNAKRIFDLVLRRLSRRSVAGSALDLGMRKDQGKSGLRVIGNIEGRRAPSLHRVAALASPPIGALEELSAVRIGLVAIGTCVMGDGSLEVSALMAGTAWNSEMFTEQRKVCLGVIKRFGKARLFPRACRVAGFASLLELSLVRITMAVRTTCERNARVAWFSICASCVATLTQHSPVLARKRISGLGVVEVLTINARRFPVDGRVASSTICTKSALVLVLVAGDAAWRKAHPSAIQIFGSKQCARLR
jgi:hypothetical protein